jgi:hypothetical protein
MLSPTHIALFDPHSCPARMMPWSRGYWPWRVAKLGDREHIAGRRRLAFQHVERSELIASAYSAMISGIMVNTDV